MFETFVFSNKVSVKVVRHLLYWLFWAALLAFIYGTKSAISDEVFYFAINRSYWIAFVELLPEMLLLALGAYTIFEILVPVFYPSQWWWLPILAILLILLTAGEFFIIGNFRPIVNQWFDSDHSTPTPLIVFSFSNVLKHGAATIGFASAVKLFKRWWKEREANQLLKQQNLAIELQMLKQQLHPHFLFNTLNNLYGLVLENSKEAPEVLLKLSSLLSYMLYECNTDLVPLKKELQLIESYLLLEKIRFEDRLEIAYSITGDPEQLGVAPLILLPFLENSFKHGVSENLDKPWINLEIEIKDQRLHMWLANSKNMSTPYLGKGGLGLKNATKRLNLLYRKNYNLKFTDDEASFCVILEVPLNMCNKTTRVWYPKKEIMLLDVQ